MITIAGLQGRRSNRARMALAAQNFDRSHFLKLFHPFGILYMLIVSDFSFLGVQIPAFKIFKGDSTPKSKLLY